MKECMYYEKYDDGKKLRCLLCPHECVVDDGIKGICGVRINKGGILYSLNYGVVSSYAIDPIEKKPFYHFYPGSLIASVGTFGCNFKCDFCQNHNIAMGENVEYINTEAFQKNYDYITPEQLIDKINRDNIDDNIGVAFTYNEPTIWYEFILECARIAKSNGMKTVLVTNGFINEEPLIELMESIDAVNMDLKAFNEDFYKKICGGNLNVIKNNVEIVSSKAHLEISTLLIDDMNTEDSEIEELCKFIAKINASIPIHFNKFHPAYKMRNEPTAVSTLLKAKRRASKYLNYIYIGNVYGIESNTECPKCGTVLIDRDYYGGKVVNIKNGKCSICGRGSDIIY